MTPDKTKLIFLSGIRGCPAPALRLGGGGQMLLEQIDLSSHLGVVFPERPFLDLLAVFTGAVQKAAKFTAPVPADLHFFTLPSLCL